MKISAFLAIVVFGYITDVFSEDDANFPEDCSVCGLWNEKTRIRNRRIIGGKVVQPSNKYPWMVRLLADGYTCGGAIISPYHILTAAHCVAEDVYDIKYLKPEEVEIIFLETSLPAQRNRSPVEAIFPHPKFHTFGPGPMERLYADYDLAVLKMRNKIKCGQFANPICLPGSDSSFDPTTAYILAGWGFYKYGILSDKLLESRMRLRNFEDCVNVRPPRIDYLQNSTFCFKHDDGAVPCSGDSGSPLFYEQDGKFFVAGVLSFSINKLEDDICISKELDVATSVPAFMSWITEVTQRDTKRPDNRTERAGNNQKKNYI